MKEFLCITPFMLPGNPLQDRFRLRNLDACVARVSSGFPEADHAVAVQVPPGSGLPPGLPAGPRYVAVEAEGAFRKTALMNRAVLGNPGYRAYVMVDADLYMTREIAGYATENAGNGRLVFPYGSTAYLDEPDTRRLVETGSPWPGEKDPGTPIWRQTGLCVAFTRDGFDRVGGFDACFSGWGAEDDAFVYKFRRAGMGVLRNPDGDAVAYHMFHPKANSAEYLSGKDYLRNRVYCACIRRMSDEDFSRYLAGEAALDSLVGKYSALGRLETSLDWRISPTKTLHVDTTIYDIDRGGGMTVGKVLGEVRREDGDAGVVQFCDAVLYGIPDLPRGTREEIDRIYAESAARLEART